MRVSRVPGAFWDVVDGTTIVCQPTSGELYTLNATATFLWGACDDASAESLTARLLTAFPDQDAAALTADADRFLGSLLDKGLLVVDEGAA